MTHKPVTDKEPEETQETLIKKNPHHLSFKLQVVYNKKI